MQSSMNTQGTDGGSVTVALPDWDQTRRELIALRVTHGADSAIGHRCSNAIEQLETYQRCPAGTQRLALRNALGRTMTELAQLTTKAA